MKKVYSVEQKRFAVARYRRVGSYTQTIRELGYPSMHVLHDWVKESKRGGIRKKRPPRKPPRHYGFEFKEAAVNRVLDGQDARVVAADLRLNHVALLYKWVALWNKDGQWDAGGLKPNTWQRFERLSSAWNQAKLGVADAPKGATGNEPGVVANPRSRARRPLTAKQVDSIRTAPENGESVVSICRRFDVHRMTVWTHTKDLIA